MMPVPSSREGEAVVVSPVCSITVSVVGMRVCIGHSGSASEKSL
jgi:hypothetical protein